MSMDSPDGKRTGPRPLPLHLWTAATALLSSRTALQSLSAASPSSPPPSTDATTGSPGAELHKLLAEIVGRQQAVGAALDTVARDRLDAFLTGIETYRRHGYRRTLPEPPTIWQAGTTRLLDYGVDVGEDALPVLVVPSLINRSYVLDLAPGRSLLRWLAEQRGPRGRRLRPLLLDWGAPGAEEREFGLTRYIAGRVEPALEVAAQGRRRPVLAGYCMGGLLALPAAVRRPELVGGLVLLATPWNFHADQGEHARLLGQLWPVAEPLFQAMGEVPVDVLQCLFFALDPLLGLRKFAGFATVDPESAKAADFVALEDWINDGVPLATRVATECFVEWYGENRPWQGRWQVGDVPILPRQIQVPTLLACPEHDRIVPPGSSKALAGQIAHALVLAPPLGHVGMVVGSKARDALWGPLADWLLGLD
jgi:polyhydroxyalkanoate synthase subunit PhaC